MIRHLFAVLAACCSIGPAVTSAQAPPAVAGVFEGRTPCGDVAVAFTGFPSKSCEKIKWELTLNRDAKGSPSTFTYRGTRTSRQGTWRVTTGTGPGRTWTVYHLQDPTGARVLSLLRVDDNVLLVLDADRRVLVGDASWSYALNRTDRRPTLR